MRNSRIAAIVIAVAALLGTAWIYRYPAMYAWMRHSGAVAPAGLSSIEFRGKPGRIVSMIGRRPGPQMGPVFSSDEFGAYHALVVFSGDSLTRLSSTSEFGNVSGSATEAWRVWSGERGRERAAPRVFSTSYDGIRRTVRLNGRRYSLKDGNLFVVRYDARGQASVTQLRHTLSNARAMDIFHAFETLLPRDPGWCSLQHYPTKSCPCRQAAPPRGAST